MSDSILFIIDVQKDFLPGGALAVPNGDKVIDPLIKMAAASDFVIATGDYHPKDHCSFKENGGLWEPHCVFGKEGSKIDERIVAVSDEIILKGSQADKEEYSAFTSYVQDLMFDFDNPVIYVGGLATEYCVKETVLDALNEGYTVKVLIKCIRGINEKDSQKALKEIQEKGAILI